MPRGAPSTAASPPRPTAIPPKFWRACAGSSAQEPPVVNSRVYYFPQGHIDQAASKPRNLSSLVYSTPFILCRVSAVNFFADPNTDEVFLKILLYPVAGSTQDFFPIGNGNGDDEKVESYAKVLTRSDVSFKGGFSLPKSCAEMIFPPLNSEDEKPPKNFSMTDLHGTAWEFRHIYSGSPMRHILSSGWKEFVNSKMLTSDDTVIFMKDSDGKVFVGIRRNKSPDGDISDGGSDSLDAIVGTDEGEKEKEEVVMSEGFARNGKGRVSSASVAEAMELAAQNKPFEVVYYPNVGWGEFVVKAEDVEVKVNGIVWRVGMTVKMVREKFDSSRMTWSQGTVSGVSVPAHDQPWSGSPWRMLQVKWNDSGKLKNANFFSPWQVELLSDAPALGPPTKKFRTTDGEEEAFPIPDSTKELSKEALLSYYGNTSHAGMQDGASHDVPATPPTRLTDPNVDTRKRSFQLFGSTIQSEQPADESGARDDNTRANDNK